jgi:hypothetical protein
MNVFYSDSKTDLKLGRDSSIKFHPFECASVGFIKGILILRMHGANIKKSQA